MVRNFHVLDSFEIIIELRFHLIEHFLVNIDLNCFSINLGSDLFFERFLDSYLSIYHLLVKVDLILPANGLLLFKIHDSLVIVVTAVIGHLAIGVLLQIIGAVLHYF